MPIEPEIASEVEAHFVARTLDVQLATGPPVLGFADLVSFLLQKDMVLSTAQQAALFSDQRLRVDFLRLKQEMLVARGALSVPALAAASDAALSERRFEGGLIRLARSASNQKHVYVVIEFEPTKTVPTILLLHADGVGVEKLILPQPDEMSMQLLLDERSPRDASIIALIGNPATSGHFV